MPGIARGDGRDTVVTEHGCASTTTTNLCSTTVFVDGIGVHRLNDLILNHFVAIPKSFFSTSPTQKVYGSISASAGVPQQNILKT